MNRSKWPLRKEYYKDTIPNVVVDEKHQVVLHAEAFGKGEDSSIMEAMLEGAKEKLEAAGREEPLKDMQMMIQAITV
ncbi:MAG: hypothetical protein SWO11_20355 [Thermodesulfobacteriota bacterium]|nr:hypothetical protein [Thermodesulfobacteriota bacterium]